MQNVIRAYTYAQMNTRTERRTDASIQAQRHTVHTMFSRALYLIVVKRKDCMELIKHIQDPYQYE